MSRILNRCVSYIACLILVALSWLITSTAQGHVDSPLLLEGCGSCHVGHGMSRQPMLKVAEEDLCFQCHGSDDKRSAMVSAGKLAPNSQLSDVERETLKPYRHPVEDGVGHSPTERLPSFEGASNNHAECVDCHSPHQRGQASTIQRFDVSGYSLSGQYLEKSLYEYEICLKCHSEQTGVTRDVRNLRTEFSVSVRSQHPVTRSSNGARLPSLSQATAQGSTMTCSDCHKSDDPDAPKGPHGSNNRYLLSGNYDTDVVANESAYAYQFCYSCHYRVSILSNESFPLHREHIEGNALKNIPGTSCYTCHASHASRNNLNLIEFNPKAVTRDQATGLTMYRSFGNGTGECYLTCHGRSHSPEKY